jgi:heptosyltransferase-1
MLRKQFPGAKIYWFAEPAGAKLLRNVRGIDEIVVLNLKTHGFFNKVKEVRRILSGYRKRFDLVMDFQGLLKSAVFSWLLKGETIGFARENLREPLARHFYRFQAGLFDEADHVIFKNINLIRPLVPGWDSEDSPFSPVVEYPLEDIGMSPGLRGFLSRNGLEENRYVIVNVGGGWQSKLLTARQYETIINEIRARYNYKMAILWGNEREKRAASELAARTGTALCEFLDFRDLIVFLRCCRLLITADTLALHLADAVGKSSIGIFGPTSPRRNGSLLKSSVSIYEKLPCGFCYKKKCGTINCMKKVNIEKIIEAVQTVYQS